MTPNEKDSRFSLAESNSCKGLASSDCLIKFFLMNSNESWFIQCKMKASGLMETVMCFQMLWLFKTEYKRSKLLTRSTLILVMVSSKVSMAELAGLLEPNTSSRMETF